MKQQTTKENEIERLEQLLTGRQEEYRLFGATANDLVEDARIQGRLKVLKYHL